MSRYTLEEEEQLAELKAFWNKYGNFILTLLIIGFGAYAAYNGWHWWKARQASQAVKGYESLQNALAKNDLALVKKVEQTLVQEDGGSPYAQRGALLAAKAAYASGDSAFAKTQLQWAVDHAKLDEYAATARLLLSGILIEEGKLDAATKLVSEKSYTGFEGLFSDRLGDIAVARKDNEAATKAYKKALEELKPNNPWSQVVQRKLAALPKAGE
ncbi:YfgM family protein [Limnobacter litoralis]|uniref:Ancillary SecYEG translocon subunit n=1 Tax=Limnobacter litoralis TaxID=481366 RepID=A0ABQ5YSP9_9BURK|nr:tetratricopeptide repeat protein [Limnobacter litoralis]GLR25819.1 hypothetical protein GCM10007875_09070 [Limnobacter litoralis]